MNRSMVAAAALFAGIAIAATPMFAWSADDQPASGQTAPHAAGMPGMGHGPMGFGMMGGMGDAMHDHEGGPMHRFGAMREMMMRRMARQSPEQRCEEGVARRAAWVAYTGTLLRLTPEQRPLWDKLNTTLQTQRDKQQQFCDSLKAAGQGGKTTVLDRLDRAERFLSTRLDALHQVRPVFEQLYQSLSPEQKTVINEQMHG